MVDFFEAHAERLEMAIRACRTRGAWSPFVESPSRKHHPEGALSHGRDAFEALLGTSFPLDGAWSSGRIGEEVSPYTRKPLAVDYPEVSDVDALFEAARRGQPVWADVAMTTRVGVCLEMLERWHQMTFQNAFATMHTAGQAFMMAFAGSGANSLDRGLEALAYAYRAMGDVPESATYTRRFGREPVRLEKRYRLRPRGVAVVITCASYPAWNAYPAIMANLATGNPVIVKPHPGGTLPMALAVHSARQVLAEAGFDPNLVTLAADTAARPIAKRLATHGRCAIVDFTGGCEFGAWLEDNCRNALVYTETAGCNAVIVESTTDAHGMLHAIAQSLALFSSQMCTAAQNIFVPQTGVQTDLGLWSVDDFSAALVATIDELVSDSPRAAAICGALQSDRVLETIATARLQVEVLRESSAYTHPEFGNARTATPLLCREEQPHTHSRTEWFGPIGFVLPVPDAAAARDLAAADARERGAIASYLYTCDDEYADSVEEAFFRAGASIGRNLIGHLPINFTAGFSDYHVTGLNPAGNACLTDLAFVANRFRIVQSKTELRSDS